MATPAKKARSSNRVVLKGQARELITKVYEFMKTEATAKYATKLSDARWRTSQATGVSESTVTRILREKKITTRNADAVCNKKRRAQARKINLDDFDVGEIRRSVLTYYKEYNQPPTLSKLKVILKQRVGFDGCLSTLRKLLMKLDFKWKRTLNGRKIMLEKHEIQMSRLHFLKQIKNNRLCGRPIVYTDEIFLDSDQCQGSNVTEDSKTPTLTKPKGPRVIVMYAASAKGFIPGALTTFQAEMRKGNFRDNIDSAQYLSWLKDNIIPNLPKKSVLVINDVTYTKETEPTPNTTSTKKTMIEWLTKNNIKFDPELTRIELYDMILKSKRAFQSYICDELLKDHDFEIIRLPPNHRDLNPLSGIWNILKNYTTEKDDNKALIPKFPVTTVGLEEIIYNLCSDGTWARACKRVEEIEDEYMKHFYIQYHFNVHVCDTDDSCSDSEDSASELSDNFDVKEECEDS